MNNKAVTTILVAILAFAGGYFLKGFVGGDRIQSEAQVNLSNDWDSLSYFLGLTIGYQTVDLFDEIDPAIVGSGLNTVINDSSLYDEMTTQRVAMDLQQRIVQKMAQEGIDFLADNALKESVFTTASGLQYETLAEGDGPMPVDTSVVTVHYRGTFIDGREFDSSIGGEPATFSLNRVISGWTEGLQLMSVGSKYRFYVPSDLAYGPRGTQGIPPNSTLIFEVELLAIEGMEPAMDPTAPAE